MATPRRRTRSAQTEQSASITTFADPLGETQTEINQLKARVATLEREVEGLKASAPEEVIVLRTITREQAKQEILNLFQSGAALDQAEVAERLSLRLSTVAELCEELIQEGEIQYHDVDGN